MENKSKFVSLRRTLPILLFILFAAIGVQGQDTRTPNPNTEVKVRVYPNPAESYITIDFQNNYQKGLTLVVYSFLGKKMYESQNVTEKTTLNLSEYNRGVYFYHIMDPSNKLLLTGKFQVSR